jgi:hypothetical protein
MTDEMMNLRALVEKTPAADLPREMIGFDAERLMELEVGALTEAGHGEKSPNRGRPDAFWQNHRGRCRTQPTLLLASGIQDVIPSRSSFLPKVCAPGAHPSDKSDRCI